MRQDIILMCPQCGFIGKPIKVIIPSYVGCPKCYTAVRIGEATTVGTDEPIFT